jgi:hypothetical protein
MNSPLLTSKTASEAVGQDTRDQNSGKAVQCPVSGKKEIRFVMCIAAGFAVYLVLVCHYLNVTFLAN